MTTTPIGGAEVFYDVLALTSMWNWNVSARLTLNNSIRIDRWELGRNGYLRPDYVEDFGLTNDIWEITRDETSFNSGLIWRFSSGDSIRFSSGRARQLPNLLNLGGDFSEFLGFFFLGVPWLEPTNVSNSEVHWQHELPDTGISLGLGLFRGATEDVQSVFFGNLGNSRTGGVEATVEGIFGDHWRWNFSLLRQEIEDDLDSLFPAEWTLVNFEDTTPEWVLKGHVAWTRGPWEIDGFVQYQSRSLGLRAPDPGKFSAHFVEIPGHVRLDARIGYAISSDLRISVSGRSLTRSNLLLTAAPDLERQVYASLRYTF